jgi:hypothetical protein
MAMNSPYGIGWGPATTGGIVFNILYFFFCVGLFLLFVLEAGKTMAQSCEAQIRKMTERKALKQAMRQPAAEASRER